MATLLDASEEHPWLYLSWVPLPFITPKGG